MSLQTETAIDYALTAAGVRRKGGPRHPQADTQIQEWLTQAGFYDLVAEVKTKIDAIRARLIKAGFPTDLIDEEIVNQLTEWALVAGHTTPAPIPPARSALRRPWLRLLKDI